MGTNADVVRRLTDEAFIAGTFDTWAEIVSGDFVDNDPMQGLPPTTEGLQALAQMVVGTFEDRDIEAEHLETPDGRVVENWVFTGRHTGEAMGIPPSGEAIRIRGIEIWRVADDKIVERWGVIDVSDVMQKAGLVPPS
jgi:steroid delta-isomerase-like uncharacterized protein